MLEEVVSIVETGDVSALKSISYSSVINNYTYGRTLLCLACEKGNLEIVKELIKCDGIDVNKGVSVEWSEMS